MTRIIAGLARGRTLRVPPGSCTRPTADRVREALFASLSSRVELAAAPVLDLYAGTGALGLEALSRGAPAATFVECERAALVALRANIAALGLAGAHVVAARVTAFLARPARPQFGLVLLDPPYDVDVDPVLARLPGWLAPGAAVVVERARRGPEPGWPAGLVPDGSRRYGDTLLWYAALC